MSTGPFTIGITPRLRRSPYFEATVAAGVRSFTVYNHMLMPSGYGDPEAEYRSLIDDVAVWDVAGERQVEIRGPDAPALAQLLVTRDVAKCPVGAGRYTFICNEAGGVLNDPVLLRLAEDHFWISLADRDILLWAQAWAGARGMKVTVQEPDVSPLQIQGPKSPLLVEDLFGEEVRAIGYYRLIRVELDGTPLVVTRTGWSGEMGYEVFLQDGSRGRWLWDRVFEAGRPYNVAPGTPNQIRRIEGGLLSYGTDMDDTVNPLELGMEKFVALDSDDDFVGQDALRKIKAEGVTRLLTGLRIDGDPLPMNQHPCPVLIDDRGVGIMTSCAYSPRFEANLGFGLLAVESATPNAAVVVHHEAGPRTATTEPLPFLQPVRD